jgi:hypothetical protein
LYSGVVELQNNERLLKESLSVKLGRYHWESNVGRVVRELGKGKYKGKVRTRTGHENPEGE